MNSATDGQQDTSRVAPITLHVATWGPPTRHRAVVLVHGLTASHREFVELGPMLATRGWYVLAPDLRGRGLSSKPPHGYGIAIHANDLLTICDTLGLESVHIVGHSLGAVIGLYAAALYPGRVGKLVMVDAGGKVPEDTAQAIAASVSRLGTVYPSLDAYLGAMSQLPMITWGPFWEQYFRYDAEVHADGTVTSRVPRAAIEEESAALWATRTEELPPLVRAPTLVLRAALGTLGPDRGIVLPAEEAERLRTVMPDCRVEVMPGVNYYTIVQAPGFSETIASFLERDVEDEAMQA
jgi:pimeloyl-ACP methyl ester carboxylesterase